MNKYIPIYKGFITGILMIALIVTLYNTNQPNNSPLQLIVYAIYMGGILWTIIPYSRSEVFSGKFSDLFGQGFRCFIIVILIMVIFTWVFSVLHPEFAEQSSMYVKEQLIKQGNKIPSEIEAEVSRVKKQYTTGMVSISVFKYLLLGALFTAIGSGIILSIRKKS